MTKPKAQKAKKHLARLRQLAAKRRSPLSRLSEEKIIRAIRQVREQIWDKKLAARP